MPLVGHPDVEPVFHRSLRGIAFVMLSNEMSAAQQVRVVVTLQALAQFCIHPVDDPPISLQCFDRFRKRIEDAASAKFERIDSQIQEYEGIPTFMLMTGDPI